MAGLKPFSGRSDTDPIKKERRRLSWTQEHIATWNPRNNDLEKIPQKYNIQVRKKLSFLLEDVEGRDTERLWEEIKTSVLKIANESIPKRGVSKRSL